MANRLRGVSPRAAAPDPNCVRIRAPSISFTTFMSKMEPTMAKVYPFHSIRVTARNVHHDNDRCTEGNNIETYNRRSGTAGRPLCDHCARM